MEICHLLNSKPKSSFSRCAMVVIHMRTHFSIDAFDRYVQGFQETKNISEHTFSTELVFHAFFLYLGITKKFL